MQDLEPSPHHPQGHTGPEPCRYVVRFPTLRKAPQPGFLNMDTVLDRLGATRFPSQWGRGDAWKHHPFAYDRASRSFVQYELVLNDGRYRLAKYALKAPGPKHELRACHKSFRSVRQELAGALAAGHIAASKLFVDGKLEPINKTQSALWGTQMRAIFYSGYGHEFRHGGDCKYRVQINEQSFGDWVNRSGTVEQDGVTPSESFLRQLATALAERAAEGGYRMKRNELFGIVREELKSQGLQLSERHFDACLWAQPSLKPHRRAGRPVADLERRLSNDTPHIRALIRDLCSRRSNIIDQREENETIALN
jgi:hypothetical protein